MTPLLVGSVAASLTGCLPAWRNGVMIDYDFYGDCNKIAATVVAHTGKSLESWQGNGSYVGLDPRSSLRIDVKSEDDVSAAIRETRDLKPVQVLGVECLAISVETQLALKLAYLRNHSPHEIKNSRDVEAWLKMPMNMSHDHIAVFVAMWHKAEQLFNLAKADPLQSFEFSRLMDGV